MATKKHKTYQILCFLCFVAFSYYKDGTDDRTCSERSERNSISEQVYLQSVAPAAQRAGANKRSTVCRQNVVLFQVRCRMKKDNPFGLSFFGTDDRTCSELASVIAIDVQCTNRVSCTQCRLQT